MKSDNTVRIRMLGNAFEYENGEEYDVAIARANQLTGLGYAVIIEAAAAPAGEDPTCST
jgi:hypothetical protein